MNSRIIFTLIVISFLCNNLRAQSAWDIKYVFEDSISNALVGKEVKLDFIGRSGKLTEFEHPRGFLAREDQSQVVLCGMDTVNFQEKRSIHVDWGLLREQFLESYDYLNDESVVMRVNTSIIREVKDDSIYFELHTSIIKVRKRKEENIGNKVFMVWINRNQLDGVMIATD